MSESIASVGPSLFSGGLLFPLHAIADWAEDALADGVLDFAIAQEAAFAPGQIFYQGAQRIDPAVRDVLRLNTLGPYHATIEERALAEKPNLERALGVPGFTVSRVEIELAAHGDGAHFNRHIDTLIMRNRRPKPRILTLIWYLHRRPKAFSGGTLRMHAIGGERVRDVAPDHNLLIAFPSNAPHSVRPVECPGNAFADRRFAVNIWIHG